MPRDILVILSPHITLLWIPIPIIDNNQFKELQSPESTTMFMITSKDQAPNACHTTSSEQSNEDGENTENAMLKLHHAQVGVSMSKFENLKFIS